MFKSVRPWLKFDVYNLFNDLKLISWNTTVNPANGSPVDSMGLPTQYSDGRLYGQATSARTYPAPFQGQVGGRTFRVSFGLRW